MSSAEAWFLVISAHIITVKNMEDGSAEDCMPDVDDSIGRHRSNSDPGHRENKVVMNGKNTIPKSRAPSYLKATGQDKKTAPRTATPPPSRKNKFAASISRLFRPWKWRRRRKSERFITTSENLERQLSVRAKREELVKKGILPPAIGTLPEDDSASVQNPGTQVFSGVENSKSLAVCSQKEASLKSILKSSPVPQRAAGGGKQLQIRQINQSNMMDQLSRKLASRTSGSYTSQEVTSCDEQLVSGGEMRGQTNAQWAMVVNVQSTDNSHDSDKENTGSHVSSELVMQQQEDDNSSEEEEECGIVTHLASKLKRTDSLALKLKVRPSKVELQEKNILHSRSEVQTQEQRAEVGSKLVRRLSARPTAQELRERNILKSSSEEEANEEREEKKKVLTRKLSRRPTIQELKARKILKFSEYVESGECHDYDRRADKPWTRLTPEDKAAIRKELNEYKSAEMEVHEDSRQYTRFHRP